jgi:hypothetical protein
LINSKPVEKTEEEEEQEMESMRMELVNEQGPML